MRPTANIAFAAVAFVLAAGFPAQSQNYPSQTIKIVVPFPPGGGVDVVARVIAPRLSELLGQSVIIENRGGAGGSVGATDVAQSRARRLHAAARHRQHARNQLERLRQARLRSGARLRAGRAGHVRAAPAGRQQRRAGEDRRRADRARQGQAGRAGVRLVRQRQQQSPGRRAVQHDGRHRDQPHSLSRLGADDDRPDRRPHPVRLRRHRDDPRLCPQQHGAPARRVHRQALSRPSRRADDCRIRRSRASKPRCGSPCSRRPARRRPRRPAEQQGQRRAGAGRGEGELPEASATSRSAAAPDVLAAKVQDGAAEVDGRSCARRTSASSQ